jgi:hypothetical protein
LEVVGAQYAPRRVPSQWSRVFGWSSGGASCPHSSARRLGSRLGRASPLSKPRSRKGLALCCSAKLGNAPDPVLGRWLGLTPERPALSRCRPTSRRRAQSFWGGNPPGRVWGGNPPGRVWLFDGANRKPSREGVCVRRLPPYHLLKRKPSRQGFWRKP